MGVRLATINDADRIGEVARSAGFRSRKYPSARYCTWVAVADGTTAGFLDAGFDSDFTEMCRIPKGVDRHHGFLSLLAVLPSHRRAGLASALLRAYCIAAPEQGVAFVVGNPSAMDDGLAARTAFFARCGLVEVGVGPYHHLIGAKVGDVLDRIGAGD